MVILACLLDLKSITFLRFEANCVWDNLEKALPETILDRSAYLNGLRAETELLINTVYKPLLTDWTNFKKHEGKPIPVETPRELLKVLSSPKPLEYRKRKVWEKAHGEPNCQAYATKLTKKLEEMAHSDPRAVTEGKRPISAWAKAELDLRNEEQMTKLDKLIKHGYRLCWLSSHADCSERCAPWQGKLVDIVHLSHLPSCRMPYKKDGNAVYSLRSIMSKVDRYGYKNNIINGFNCRHRLIPYAEGSKPPKKFPKKVMERERQINSTLRAMERDIREAKRKAILYNEFDRRKADLYAKQAKELTKAYKAYAKANGYTAHNYRLGG